MKKIKRLKMALVILGGMSMIFSSCSEDDLAIQGCTDITATNYIVSATVDDGTCSYLSDLFIGEYSIEDSLGLVRSRYCSFVSHSRHLQTFHP